jgi:hypothetical protein
MKLSRMLLVAMFVIMSAAVAKADGIPDPHIIINSCSLCDAATFDATNSASNPLVLDFFNATEDFQYVGTTPLTELFIEINPVIVPGVYDCTSDIFTTCQPWAPPADQFGLEFLLSGGTIEPGQFIAATVTPEPSTLLMLAMGIIALLAFRRKFGFSANQA